MHVQSMANYHTQDSWAVQIFTHLKSSCRNIHTSNNSLLKYHTEFFVWFSGVTAVGNRFFSDWWPFSLVMHCLPKHPQHSTHFSQLRTVFDQALLFRPVEFITRPVKGIQFIEWHCDRASLCTMPRVSRHNPACDGSNEEPKSANLKKTHPMLQSIPLQSARCWEGGKTGSSIPLFLP